MVMGDELELDTDAVLSAVREFSTVNQQEKALASRKKDLRDRLALLVEMEGETDDKGNLVLGLPEICGDILALQLQRRSTRLLDADLAEDILKRRIVDGQPLWDRCVEWVAVLDEGKVMAEYYAGHLTEAEVDEMYPEKESFAFVPIRTRK